MLFYLKNFKQQNRKIIIDIVTEIQKIYKYIRLYVYNCTYRKYNFFKNII